MTTFNVNELNSLYGQLNQLSGNSLGSTGFGQAMQSYNDIAWFGQAISNLNSEEVNSEEKANIVNQLVQRALPKIEEFISKFASNEATRARKEVAKENKDAQSLIAKSENTKVRVEGEFSQIASDIDNQTAIVEDASEALKETQKAVEEKQKEMEELVKQIEEQQAIVSDPDKTNEEKLSALGVIQGLSAQISEIVVSIESDNETIQQLSSAVENASNNIETSTAQMEVVEQDGEAQIQQLSSDASKTLGEVAKTGQDGTINEATAVETEAAAQAASTNTVTGATIAPKLYRVANDQQQAGSTRLSSIQANVNQLAQGIGNLSNSKNIVRDFKHSIGKSLGNYGKAIGSWDTALSPVIQSIGSISAVGGGLEDLNNAVTTDITSINEYSGLANQDKNLEEKTEQNEKANNEDNEDNEDNDHLEFETPKVKLTRSFGI